MFIQTEETPNPATLKFIPDGIKISNKNHDFKNKNQAMKSPLAIDLFNVEGVESVFFGQDFITITKNQNCEWKDIKIEIMAAIIDFFVAEKKAVNDENDSEINDCAILEGDSEVVKQIKELIEIKVKPSVAMDGGDVIFKGFNDGIVSLELKGSCSGCPSSTITLKSGIENMLKHYVPEVIAVEQFFSYDE